MDEKNSKKIILSLCGGTGAWERPYKEAGYDVRLITLPDHDILSAYVTSNGFVIFPSRNRSNDFCIELKNIYGILAAPPCTEFSFAKSNSKYPKDMRKGMETVRACLDIIWQCQLDLPTPLAKRTNLKFWALENPLGLLSRYLGRPPMIFNPYDFGDPYQKKTCLWGYFNEPKKKPTSLTDEISPNGKPLKKFDQLLTKEISPEHYGKLTRADRRSITPPGFARAFFKANK